MMILSPFSLLGTSLLLTTMVSPFSIVPSSSTLSTRGLTKAAGSVKSETCLFLSTSPSSLPSDDSADNEEEGKDLAAVDVDDLLDDAEDDEGKVGLSANPFYGFSQMQHASESPDDKRLTTEENEARRQNKIREWTSALSSSNLNWGNRRAVADVPVWATPRVLGGGFVSGELLAQLQDNDVPNEYYLTFPGLVELDHLLESGCYRTRVPEHAALLMVAWLLRNDQEEEAKQILKEIAPYFQRLRFYPDKVDSPFIAPTPSSLFLSSVGDVKETIEEMVKNEGNSEIPRSRLKIAQRKALQDWLPLKWKLLALWSETCRNGQPAKQFPENWNSRARLLLYDFLQLATRDQETNGGRIRNGSTKIMVSCIETCLVRGKDRLSDKNKSFLKTVLTGSAKKYALSDPRKFAARLKQLQSSIPPDKVPQMRQLIDRLAEEDLEVGLSQHVIDEIAAGFPENLQKYVKRSRMGSLEELIEHGLVSSSEVLADLVPALMAQSVNSNVPDESLKRLGAALDLAFSSRQSVILFNLQSQVRFEELPWAFPLLRYRQGENESTNESALAALKLITESAINTFPQTILPNKLLQSMRTLSDAANLDLPLTEELAADICMGQFSRKFQKSAHKAAELLEGSVYETYFLIDYGRMRKQENPLASFDPSTLVANRHAIEQQQILTTHNLAACYSTLELELDGRKLALKIWDWMLGALQQALLQEYFDWNADKNVGYAWRQLVFFVSVAPDNTDGLVEEMREQATLKLPSDNSLVDALFISQLEVALNGETPAFAMLGCPAYLNLLCMYATPYTLMLDLEK